MTLKLNATSRFEIYSSRKKQTSIDTMQERFTPEFSSLSRFSIYSTLYRIKNRVAISRQTSRTLVITNIFDIKYYYVVTR